MSVLVGCPPLFVGESGHGGAGPCTVQAPQGMSSACLPWGSGSEHGTRAASPEQKEKGSDVPRNWPDSQDAVTGQCGPRPERGQPEGQRLGVLPPPWRGRGKGAAPAHPAGAVS